jgi:acetyl esterase
MNPSDYFTTDPDWAEYASQYGYPIPPKKTVSSPSPERTDARTWDFQAIRAATAASEQKWASKHKLSHKGYEFTLTNIPVRDGSHCSVKFSWPNREHLEEIKSDTPPRLLPILFVTHGGGWIQGTHVTEEEWLLWPLYERFDFFIASVEYRLAPEHECPKWVEDSWDVLQRLLDGPRRFLPNDSDIQIDSTNVYLAGSSAGGGISATLSQMCRDNGIRISGVILNVPLLCDYRDIPAHLRNKPTSYEQCIGTFSDSCAMMALWDMIRPSDGSQSLDATSPLLGNVAGLPSHLMFVAGQDPLRDEGIAYWRKLQEESVPVELRVYPGVPHNFGQFWALKATKRFWQDLVAGLEILMKKG